MAYNGQSGETQSRSWFDRLTPIQEAGLRVAIAAGALAFGIAMVNDYGKLRTISDSAPAPALPTLEQTAPEASLTLDGPILLP